MTRGRRASAVRPSAPPRETWTALAIASLVAALASLIVFWPIASFALLNWDDQDVFVRNAALTQPGVMSWAFTTTHLEHFQPLSWLVWSAVVRASDGSPYAIHALSVVTHAVNAALTSVLAWMVFGRFGWTARTRGAASGAAALIWSLHPLRVEAVAWASAFPYTLAMTGLLVSAIAWLSPSRRGYAVSLSAFAASLAARPIGLAFPIALLALAVWPRASAPGPDSVQSPVRLREALTRIAPFVVLAALAAALELRARPLYAFDVYGLAYRLGLACASPFFYIWRTVSFGDLPPLDALPIAPQVASGPVVLGALAILAACAAAWTWRATYPAAATTWFVYLALLIPVLGLTPSALQARANRYVYVAGVPIALAIAGGVTAMAVSRRRVSERSTDGWAMRAALGVSIAGIGLGAVARTEAAWWRDSITLWSRAVALTPENDVASYNLASALAEAGRTQEAMASYEKTLALVPDHAPARKNLNLLKASAAIAEADGFAQRGDVLSAIPRYEEALALDPMRSRARASLGYAYLQTGRAQEGAETLQRALAEGVSDPAVANACAFALREIGRDAQARDVLAAALLKRSGDVGLRTNLARLLATTADAAVRDAVRARSLAAEANDLTQGRDPRVLDTLAHALAANNETAAAQRAVQQAIEIADRAGDQGLAAEIRMRWAHPK